MKTLKKLDFGKPVKFKKVEAFRSKVMGLTEENELVGWGSNKYYCLGTREGEVRKPQFLSNLNDLGKVLDFKLA